MTEIARLSHYLIVPVIIYERCNGLLRNVNSINMIYGDYLNFLYSGVLRGDFQLIPLRQLSVPVTYASRGGHDTHITRVSHSISNYAYIIQSRMKLAWPFSSPAYLESEENPLNLFIYLRILAAFYYYLL